MLTLQIYTYYERKNILNIKLFSGSFTKFTVEQTGILPLTAQD